MSEIQCTYVSVVSGQCLLRVAWLVTDARGNTSAWSCTRHRHKFPGKAVPYKP